MYTSQLGHFLTRIEPYNVIATSHGFASDSQQKTKTYVGYHQMEMEMEMEKSAVYHTPPLLVHNQIISLLLSGSRSYVW